MREVLGGSAFALSLVLLVVAVVVNRTAGRPWSQFPDREGQRWAVAALALGIAAAVLLGWSRT